jgi:hypothetical protein
MRRRRRVAERIRRWAGRHRPLAVDRHAGGVDHAPEPPCGGPHGSGGRADDGTAAAADTFERPERHQQRVGAGESNHFANDIAAGAGLDHHPRAHRHGVDRSRDLNHQPAHADDAAVNLDPVQFLDLLGERFHGKPAFTYGVPSSVSRHRLVAVLNFVFTRVVNHCVTV